MLDLFTANINYAEKQLFYLADTKFLYMNQF